MELPRFAWTVTGMVRDDEPALPDSYRYIDARGESLIREDERAACAAMARAAEPLIYGLLCKSYTRKVMAEKITAALASAIEARGRA
jgi:hypothetical protein